MILPTRRISLVPAAPMVIAPAVNTTAEPMMAGLRPNLTTLTEYKLWPLLLHILLVRDKSSDK